MRIYKLSKVVALPFMLVLLFFIVQVIKDTSYEHLAWIIVPISGLVLIYLFQPQIDYWWLKRNPIELDEKIIKMFKALSPLYNRLDENEKKEFERNVVLFAEAKEFIAKGSEDNKVPYDIRMMLSQVAVSMSIHSKDPLLSHYERIILYKHPFPTPKNKFLHTFETHQEDGVIILALEYAEAGLFHPDNYYNVAGHAFADAIIKSNTTFQYPAISEKDWDKIISMCGYGKEQIAKTLGFEQVDLMVVLFNLYHTKREKFAQYFPAYAKVFEAL